MKVSMAQTNTSYSSSKQRKFDSSSVDKVKSFPGFAIQEIWKVGKEDPRRVIHAFKVGLALTLVSLLYLMEPLFKGIGSNAMWAVMTVVVVMEFTVGATLAKGLNRGFGTLLAGSLAFLIEYVANCPGHIFKAIFIGAAVFTIGTLTTYVRFIPYIKKNCDYGVLIFLLTFNLITISSYRAESVWKIAKDRISTIAIGCCLCLVMSILVFPNWSGEDLHNSTISKLEGLATSIEVCVMRYFYDSATPTNEDEDPIYAGYKGILDSKTKDETLALQASWEPRYSKFCHQIPWPQYAKVGAALRQFSYSVAALHGCLQSEIKTPKSICALYKDSCINLSEEVSKVLRELANSIRNNRQFCPETLSNNLNEALQDLDDALKSHPQIVLGSRNGRTRTGTPVHPVLHPEQKLEEHTNDLSSSFMSDTISPRESKSRDHSRELPKKVLRTQKSTLAILSLEFSEALPFAAFTSLLLEMVAKLDHVVDEVQELGRKAHYREFRRGDEIVVNCEKPMVNTSQNDLPSYGGE